MNAAVQRLIEADILAEEGASLATTRRWRGAMMRTLQGFARRREPDGGPERAIVYTLLDLFPDADVDKIVQMTRVLLHVEACEAGLHLRTVQGTKPSIQAVSGGEGTNTPSAKARVDPSMFTGLDPKMLTDTQVVGRLIAAGILDRDRDGLRTTDRWQTDMMRELAEHPDHPVDQALGQTLTHAFPGAPDDEIGLMARVMLFIEARESGWRGE